jgi:Na+/melibiose symporter-like transporter
MPDNHAAPFRRRDYIKITLFGFALTALWQSFHTIILPVRLLDFVEEAQKNTYLGLMTLTGLLLAMLVQPIAGAISDRSGFKWGRRRPFILAGGIAMILLIPGIGLAGSFAAIFAVYCLLQLASNTAQSPYQAFVPEMAPRRTRGLASGTKALVEILGGVTLVSIAGVFMGRYTDGMESIWLWLVLGVLAAVVLGAMIATIVLVKEKQYTAPRGQASLLQDLFRTAKEAFARRAILWFLASRLLVYMAFTTIQQFALYFLKDVIGVADPEEATALFSIVAVAGMVVVVWPVGYLSDRIGRKPLTIAAGLVGAAGIGVIALSQEYSTILWAAGIIGMAIGAFNSANWALAIDLVPEGKEARYLGISNMATAGGAALARAIGPAIDFFNGKSENMGYTFMLLVCVVYFIAGAALVFKIRPPRPAAF